MRTGSDDPCSAGSDLNSPAELINARFRALQAGDYAQLYASYHPESPFLQQFPECSAYVRFARQQLSAIKVVSWQALASRELAADRLEQLLAMEVAVDGQTQMFYELALLVKTGAGWRYHSAQKLSGEDYPGPPEQIDFHHFDIATQKIRY